MSPGWTPAHEHSSLSEVKVLPRTMAVDLRGPTLLPELGPEPLGAGDGRQVQEQRNGRVVPGWVGGFNDTLISLCGPHRL